MDEKTKDRFWFGILLSFFFVVFTILAFVAITMTVGMDNEAQWIMIMYLLHSLCLGMVSIYVFDYI